MAVSRLVEKTMFDALLRRALNDSAPQGEGGKLSIVIFHRVHGRPDPLFPNDPDRNRFDKICRWLKCWFNVLPLDEAVSALRELRLPARALSITFDDGYADNHNHALPVLQALGLSATFFIATGFIGGGRMWNDTAVESIRRCTLSELDLRDLDLVSVDKLDLSDIVARRKSLARLLDATKYLPPRQRDDVVAMVSKRAAVHLPDDLMMSREQLQAMAKSGMVLGAHTVNHPILAKIDDGTARTEILVSRCQLQEWLQRDVTLFAYPNGRPELDYLPRDVALAQELGFQAAVSTSPGANDASTSLFELRRFTPWDRSRWGWGVRLAINLNR
jgi:peptidoglycan/xylan/chitin deacetylase (PgdA/CDA1 family)